MGYFKPLLELTVEHSFFVNGLCKGLTFIPTSSAKSLMQQYQLLLKSSDFGLVLLKDVEHSVVVDELITLRFEVVSTDLYFSTYTERVGEQDKVLYYSTDKYEISSFILVPSDVSKSELAVPQKGAKKILSLPVFVIDICINSDNFSKVSGSINDAAQKFFIKFNARALHWKYYFFGELAALDLEIYDFNSQSPEKFDVCAEPVAKNGKAYISQELILLSEAPGQRFQLKDKNNSGKSLIKRLPNANVQLLGKGRNSSGQSVLVAEIYINQ